MTGKVKSEIKRATLVRLVIVIGTAIIAAAITLGMNFLLTPAERATETPVTDDRGIELAAICIADITDGVYTLTQANYTPDEFVATTFDARRGAPIDIYDTALAQRGTLQFAVLNLDPNAGDIEAQSQKLAPYLDGDGKWHFTLLIPPCFDACNIYVRNVLTSRSGAIENYDFTEFGDFVGVTESHVSGTEPVFIDLGFDVAAEAGVASDELDARGTLITIHYEAKSGLFSGLTEAPIIGADHAVRQIRSVSSTTLTVVALLSVIIAAVIAFINATKRSTKSLPEILATVSICLYAFTKFLMLDRTVTPYALCAISMLFEKNVIVAATFALGIKIKRIPVWALFTSLAGVNVALATAAAILPAATAAPLYLCVKIISCVLAAYITGAGVISAFGSTDSERLIFTQLTAAAACAGAFLPIAAPIVASPILWLFILIICVTVYSTFKVFTTLERRNRILTSNIQAEVDQRTAELTNILGERDAMLRYISHDMKKPILSIKRFLTDLKQDEQNKERLDKLGVIEGKLDGIESDLSDIGKFAKTSFTSEKSSTIELGEALERVYSALEPDCEANDIHLHLKKPNKIFVYAKTQMLNSVISNLVFNAIEHSECRNIYLAASKSKNKCKITVTDDGKGIDDGIEVFKPYFSSSEDNGENLGLGLYLCKQHLISMGGDVAFSRSNGRTIFTVTLRSA